MVDCDAYRPFDKNTDDRSILDGIARRETAALGALYDRHSGAVFSLCLRVLKDRSAAEESLEDIFWEIWNKPQRYDSSRGTALAYIMSLTRSRAIDRLRARLRRLRIESASGLNTEHTPANDVGTGNTPLHAALDAEQRDRIGKALATLTPDQRAVVELAFFDGLTHVEIAAKLSQPLGTVKTRIRQGLVHLRETLRVEFGGEQNYSGVRPPSPAAAALPEEQRDLT